MRKDSRPVQQQKEQDVTHFCVVCNQEAQLMCGKCQNMYYCKADHQKLHWRIHSKNCKSAEERRKEHLNYKRMRKTQIFDLLARKQIQKSIDIVDKLILSEKEFLHKESRERMDIEMQIELGSSVCVNVRLLIAKKNFSQAQDLLSYYFKQNNSFLINIQTVKSKEQLDQMDEKERKRWLYLISGKLKLISTLANLMHQLIRNSVDMFSILIAHYEKVYGIDSLQLSNVYFYTANYLNFLNQNTKALACFLKAAKMRKEKGGTAYYNAALLMLKANRKKKALQFFHKALQLIEGQKNNENNYVIAEIYENIALIYIQTGQSKAMIDYFQKAYFYYIRNNNKEKAEIIMKLFILIRKQAKQEGGDDMKTIEFSKERKDKRPYEMLSSKNRQKYRNADKIAEDDQRKIGQWLAGFKELKLNYNQPSVIKPPKQLEYLIGNQVKNGDQEDQSMSMNENNRLTISQGLNMDLDYMKSLTSIEVGYLHELNRLLLESKQAAAYYDIVENSNFYQNVSGDRNKLNNFYRLNQKLVRPTDFQRKLLMQINQQDFENQQQFQHQYNVIPPKRAPITPKLDFTKLKGYQNE